MIGLLSDDVGIKRLFNNLIMNSKAFKKKLLFYYYKMIRDISQTFAYARCGIKEWQNIKKNFTNISIIF